MEDMLNKQLVARCGLFPYYSISINEIKGGFEYLEHFFPKKKLTCIA